MAPRVTITGTQGDAGQTTLTANPRGLHTDPGQQVLPAADPLTPTQMFLEIERITPYDRNPRKQRNPLYDEIRESIRAQGGLNNPLTITRRPGEKLFTVESGGNTRLRILHELWRETGDERFYRIHCLFRPWVSESHVLTAHLIENDKRGALTFIDKALGVRELRDLLQAERRDALSQRQLAESLRERGYATDQSMVSRMDYAVDVLLPLIPEALCAGTGPTQIRRIRRLENACRDLWTDRGQAPEGFTAMFADALAAHDGPNWDLDAAQREMETRFAERLALSLKAVRLEIDARLAQSTEEPRAGPATATPQAPPVTRQSRPCDAASLSPSDPHHSQDTCTRASQTAEDPAASAAGVDASAGPRAAPVTPGIATAAASPARRDGRGDLKSLRSRCHVLALNIARRHDLEDCVHAAGRLGMGFLVDIPREAIIPVPGRADAVPQLFRQWLWWLLLSLSEEVVDPRRMAQAPNELRLRKLILEHNDAKALTLVGEPDWKTLGYELINNPSLPDGTCDDLLALMQTCRRVRHLAGDMVGAALWHGDG